MTELTQAQQAAIHRAEAKREALRRGWKTFEVKLPDGSISEVLAPDAATAAERARRQSQDGSSSGPSYQQLMDAARRAHNKGDRKAARRFLELAKESQVAPAAEPNQSGPWEKYATPNSAQSPHMDAALAEQARRQSGPWEKYAGTPEQKEALKRAALARAKAAEESSEPVGDAGGMSGAALDGLMFGVGDEYLAGLSSILGVQPDGQGGANWFDYSKPLSERYSTALDAIRGEQSAYSEANPKKAMAAELTGALLGPGKGGGAFINAGRGTATRMGRGALVGGASGAAYGFGEGEGGMGDRALSAGQSAPLGLLGGGALVGLGQGFNSALQALRKNPGAADAIPTVEGLRDAAKGLYERARALGGELPASDMQALSRQATDKARVAGFDRQLHPRVAAVLDRLTSESGPKSLQEMEILRRVAANAAQSLQPDERRIASQLIDSIDDAVEGMGTGSSVLREARDTWSRLRRLEVVEQAIENASLQDNFAAGLRNQFKALLRSPRKLRGFSDEEKALIRKVANGSLTEKSLRGLSGMLSPKTLPGMAIAGTTAFAGPGLIPAMGVAGSGLGVRAVADALTRRSARTARDAVGMNATQRGLLDAVLGRANPLARTAGPAGLLGNVLQGNFQ